jgi:hypothetical protein
MRNSQAGGRANPGEDAGWIMMLSVGFGRKNCVNESVAEDGFGRMNVADRISIERMLFTSIKNMKINIKFSIHRRIHLIHAVSFVDSAADTEREKAVAELRRAVACDESHLRKEVAPSADLVQFTQKARQTPVEKVLLLAVA